MIRTGRFARTTVVVLLGVVLLLFSSPALAAGGAGACYLVTTTITQDGNGNFTFTTTVTPIPCPPAPMGPREPLEVDSTDPTPEGVTPSGNQVACTTLGTGLRRGDQAQIDLGLLMLGASSVEEGQAICQG